MQKTLDTLTQISGFDNHQGSESLFNKQKEANEPHCVNPRICRAPREALDFPLLHGTRSGRGRSGLALPSHAGVASTVSLASIVITFLVWFPKQDRPLGALVLLPVFIPYPLCVDVWASMAGGYEPV